MNIYDFKSQYRVAYKRGFTLAELMVVIAIILIFVSIILAALSVAQQNTREKKRVADLAEIEFALTLYKAKYGSYPVATPSAEIGVGGPIDSVLREFSSRTFADPINDAPNVDYGYWYSSNWRCTENNQAILSAVTEQQKNATYDSICTANPSSNDPTGYWARTHLVILKP